MNDAWNFSAENFDHDKLARLRASRVADCWK
jgi:hypothetical protein